MNDLAAIVARDATWKPEADGSWTRFPVLVGTPPHFAYEAAIADRRALLALLRETRDALAIMAAADGKGGDGWAVALRRRNIARLALKPLAALDPLPSPADRIEATS